MPASSCLTIKNVPHKGTKDTKRNQHNEGGRRMVRAGILLASSLCSLCLGGELLAGKVTYEEHVLPVLRDKCVACHNQDKKRAGLVLDNYTRVLQGGSSGAVVKAGDPEGSALYRVVAHKEEPFMPPKSPALPKESLDLIYRWIEGGALEHAGSMSTIITRPRIDFS